MAEYTGLDKRLQYLFQHLDSCKVIGGYYYNGQMYKDSAHTELITGSTDCLYIDLSATTLYLYNGSEYEAVQGGGSGSTVTITPTLSTGTKIADYSIDGTTDSLYAPNGGSSSLDGLTDVTITTPTDGQALLYDSATGEWVNGTVQGGGGSDGTAGFSIDISLGSGQSITYSRTDLNITRKGCYLFSITSGHNAWMEYLGYFFYGGHYPGYQVSGIFSIRSSYLTVSYADGQNGTFTIKNTSGYGENQRIEILPIHPKLDVDTKVVSGYYHDDNFYEDQSYTQIITGDTDHLYIDLLTNTLYLYDGTVYVEVQGGGSSVSSLSDLTDVTLTTPTNGQLLSFDSTVSKWKNTDLPNNVISGYYHNGDFYEDRSYTQIITGDTECLYIDLDTTTLYLFDGTDYVEVQGGGGGSGGGSFACDLLLENTNLTPSGASNVNKEFTLTGSIENYDCVLVMVLGYVNSTLQEQSGTMLIPKPDYYKRAVGESGDTAIRWAFDIDISVPTGRRTLAFGFYDSTHIYTASRTTESGVECMLYKVYGLNFGGTAHTYSTTEQIVGTWIDGKPIYEISFSEVLNNITSGTAVQILDLSASGIENVIKVDGGYWYEDTTTASSKRYVAQGVYCSLEYADNAKILYGRQTFTNTTSNRKYTWIGTIQYTKSTT